MTKSEDDASLGVKVLSQELLRGLQQVLARPKLVPPALERFGFERMAERMQAYVYGGPGDDRLVGSQFDDELDAWLQKIRDEAYVDIKS